MLGMSWADWLARPAADNFADIFLTEVQSARAVTGSLENTRNLAHVEQHLREMNKWNILEKNDIKLNKFPTIST